MNMNEILIQIYLLICILSFVGVGMDACITPIRHGGLSQVQSTSVFYVLIDDPYMMVSDVVHK